MDTAPVSYIRMFASNWAILVASLIIAFPVIFYKIKNHSDEDKDLEFSDETCADVHRGVVPGDDVEVPKLEGKE